MESEIEHERKAYACPLVYGVKPEMTREGGSIPITLTFEELLGPGKGVMLLPMGQNDDGAHSQNEKLAIRNYIQGVYSRINNSII